MDRSDRVTERRCSACAAERHYWRAAVLDRFDGYVWERSRTDVGQRPLELPTVVDRRPAAGAPEQLNPDWLVRTEFTLRELQSVAIAPGALDPPTASRSTPPRTAPHSSRTALSARAMSIRPSATRPIPPRPRCVARRTPTPRPSPTTPRSGSSRELQGCPGIPNGRSRCRCAAAARSRGGRAAVRLAGSRYGEVFELARRLTAGAPTTYDAVKAIEIHLQSSYDYVEDVQLAALPLRAFLFDGRAGYCEQFSGAMALMLRMLGIPARVAAGFNPGRPDGPDRYVVRDREAHSWVEAYFTGIGWVPFDPTPSVAPAELQVGGRVPPAPRAAGLSRHGRAGGRPPAPRGPLGRTPRGVSRLGRSRSRSPCRSGRRDRAGRRPEAPSPIAIAADAAEASTQELAAALERLGWPLRPKVHPEQGRGRDARRPLPVRGGLRREPPRGPFRAGRPPPSLSERRRVRRELRRFPGWRATLDSYLAIPPGAPRRAEAESDCGGRGLSPGGAAATQGSSLATRLCSAPRATALPPATSTRTSGRRDRGQTC